MLFARKENQKEEPLKDHLKRVSELVPQLLQENNINFDPYVAKLIGFCHDCGKSDKKWQENYPSISKYPHALLTLPILHTIIENRISDEKLKTILACVVVSHHQPLKKGLYENFKKLIAEYDKNIFDLLRDEIGISITTTDIDKSLLHKVYIPSKSIPPVEKILSPLELWEKYSDRIEKFSRENEFIDLFWKLQGALIEADYLSVATWRGEKIEEFYHPFFSFNFRKRPYDWQEECKENLSNFLIIRMPTGTGKTEASLLWAEKFNPKRVFYVLPVTFAINSMFNRLKDYFSKVGIYHNWADIFLTEQDAESLDNYIYFKHMLYPIQVITPDQLILSFLHWKRWCVKLFSFLNSLFIFDEIHAYDPLLFSHLRILIDKLRKEFNAKIAIITATLPEKILEFEELSKFSILPSNYLEHYRKRYVGNVRFEEELLLHEWLEKNIDKLENEWKGKKILIITNTVERSQKIYEKINDKLKGFKKILLHSQFILKDRISKEKKIMDIENKKERSIVLIATQIVEVSLDIDYDILLTEIAPIDALIQRMGRVNRKRERMAEIIIFKAPSHKPYEKDLINESLEVIKELCGNRNDFEHMETLNKYYNKVFQFFIRKYEDAKDVWEKFESDVYAFTAEEGRLSDLIREIKVINIPAIPWKFVEDGRIHELKEEVKQQFEKYKETLSKEYLQKALNNLREIRKLLVEVPVWDKVREKISYDKDLGYWVVDFKYNSDIGLSIRVDDLS